MTFRMLLQDLLRPRHLLGDDTLRLLVYQRSRLLRIRFNETVVIPAGGVIETDIFQFITHAVERHHRISLLRSTLQVIESTGRGLLQEQLLGSTTT